MGTNTHLSDAGYIETAGAPPLESDAQQTRRVYDILAPLYPLSSWLFHSQAHRAALLASGIQNGTDVLEVATGSGEMLQRLVKANPDGQTIGVDLSPKMAARSQTLTRGRFPGAQIHCPAADVRWLPFASGSFDTVVCCFLFELLPEGAMEDSLAELSRVLRPGGRLVTTLVGQNRASFNAMYKVCNKVAPAFWGRQVETQVASLLRTHGYTIEHDRHVRQIYYSSRIIAASRPRAHYAAG